MISDFIISTTSTLNGYEVHNYFGAVTAHVVTSVSNSSDFFATFTDLKGLRSKSYKKELISLKQEVMSELKKEALKLGANCILGLSIDFDEVSGMTKNMFMVTALGTAVRVSEIIKPKVKNDIFDNNPEEYITSEIIKQEFIKNEYVSLAEAKKLSLIDESNWKTIIELGLTELIPYICEQIGPIIRSEKTSKEDLSIFSNYFSMFLSKIPENLAVKTLYDLLQNEKAAGFALDTIKELEFLDLERVIELLESSNLNVKKNALKLLYFDKSFYSKKDIQLLGRIIELISSKFPELGEKYEKKAILFSKVQIMWKCKCGYASGNEGEYCGACTKDIYGFKISEKKPEEVKSHVMEKLLIIEKYFKSKE